MIDYLKLYSEMKLSESLIDMASGVIKFPECSSFDLPQSFYYGFPPALLPLCSNGQWPGYIGIIKNWFRDGEDSFVEFFVEDFEFLEVAKNLKQLQIYMTFSFFENMLEKEEIVEFVKSLKFCEVNKLEGLLTKLENTSNLIELDIFNKLPPMALLTSEGCPKWLNPSANIDDIFELISVGNYEEAWFGINSSPFTKGEVMPVLEMLVPKVNANQRSLFEMTVEAWSAIHEKL